MYITVVGYICVNKVFSLPVVKDIFCFDYYYEKSVSYSVCVCVIKIYIYILALAPDTKTYKSIKIGPIVPQIIMAYNAVVSIANHLLILDK